MPALKTLATRVACSTALLGSVGYGLTRTTTFKKSIFNQTPHLHISAHHGLGTAVVGSVMAVVEMGRRPLGLPKLKEEPHHQTSTLENCSGTSTKAEKGPKQRRKRTHSKVTVV